MNVEGDFTICSNNANNYLHAGTINLKGNFYQYGASGSTISNQAYKGNFNASGTHKVVLIGNNKQKVFFEGSSSHFNILELTQKISNYEFIPDECWNECIVNLNLDSVYVDAIADYVYTGQEIKPEVKVYNASTLLQEGVDYTVYFENNINVASKDSEKPPRVTVDGLGDYDEITYTIPFNIVALDISTSENIVVTIDDMKYTGTAVKPDITVMNGEIKLVEDKDYTITFNNNINIGTAQVTISGTGNYVGSIVREFQILEAVTAKFIVKASNGKAIAPHTYTGEQIKPEVQVYNGNMLLTEGTDYRISYGENVNVGKGQITINGIRAYEGTKTVSFKIVPLDINNTNITVDEIQDCLFTNEAMKPKVIIHHKDDVLIENTDYKLSYSNNKKAAFSNAKKAPTVIINGKGNFKGKKKVTFDILVASLNVEDNEDLVITVADAIYNKGKECKPTVTLIDGKYKLKNKKDYTLTYENNRQIAEKNVENAPAVIITGKGNYAGTEIRVPFRICEAAIKKVKISKISKQVYNGEQIKPVVTVTIGSGKKMITLVEGKDYFITYNENINAGTGAVIVNGMGIYGGTKKATFKITPKTFDSEDIVLKPVESMYYTGKVLKPDVELYDGDTKLILNKDYKLSYSRTKKVAEASDKKAPTITITGKGNYKGKLKTTFTIMND